MKEITDFFSKLLNTADWPARWHCGEWSDFHGWLYIGSDTAIWLAYFVIPIIIMFFIQQKPNIPFLPVFWLFGCFIVLCGATHLMDVVIFWWPAYRLSALLRLLTALVSILTMFTLIRDLPRLLNMRIRKNEALDHTIEAQKNQIRELQEQIRILQQNP